MQPPDQYARIRYRAEVLIQSARDRAENVDVARALWMFPVVGSTVAFLATTFILVLNWFHYVDIQGLPVTDRQMVAIDLNRDLARMLLSASIMGLSWLIPRPTRHDPDLLEQIRKLDHVAAIGPLTETLGVKDDAIQAAGAQALCRLLPRMRPDDAGSLDAADMDRLHRRLMMRNAERDFDLLISILNAIAIIGGRTSLPYVQNLATCRTFNNVQARVQAAARQCLADLKTRLVEEDLRTTLLRPAENPSSPSDHLLRPASGASTGDPQVLLRPRNP